MIRPLAILALIAGSFSQAFSQDTNEDSHTLTVDIPEVALLDIEPTGSTITLSPAAPTEAGNPIDFTADTDNSLWLNYSSIIGTSPDNSRKVTVAVTGTLPTGANLKVLAGAYSGSGAGTTGAPTAIVTLAAAATDYDIVTGIGSCYTGNGASNGHNLTYSLTENSGSYGSLNFDTDYTLTVTYTLSDN
ncbi:MAG: hypothetical protein HY842_14655 [Bacteroidetes bacterium]|nr:hypothetical protein [Bacteroidota bacterium]